MSNKNDDYFSGLYGVGSGAGWSQVGEAQRLKESREKMKRISDGVENAKLDSKKNSVKVNNHSGFDISGFVGGIYNASGIIFDPLERYVLRLPRNFFIFIIASLFSGLFLTDFGKAPEDRPYYINIIGGMIFSAIFLPFLYMIIRFFIFLFIVLFAINIFI